MKKRTLYLEPVGGFGNRIDCVMSGIYEAKKRNMKLIVLWVLDQGCNAKLYDLIKPIEDVKVINLDQLGYRRVKGIYALALTICLRILKKISVFFDDSYIRKEYVLNRNAIAFDEAMSNRKRVYVRTSAFWIPWRDLQSIKKMICPITKIEKAVYENLKPYQDKNIIGIHIRRTDHVYTIQHSPDELFEKEMDRMCKNNSNCVFFLATDDKDVEEKFRKKYNIIPRHCFSKEVLRSTKNGMLDACVDLWTLSRCKEVWNCCGSTFSRLAAFIGDIPLYQLSTDFEEPQLWKY